MKETVPEYVVDGCRVTITRPGISEMHEFATPREAESRAAVANEAITWVGTPFRNCADIKGLNGGVDCAMLVTRCFVDTGRMPPFDPRPYPPDWMLHSREQKFIDWMENKLGGKRVETFQLGSLLIWQYGLTYSHIGIVVNSKEVIHAYAYAGLTLRSRILDSELDKVSIRRQTITRPRLIYEMGA